MENVNQAPEVVADLTKEQLDQALAESKVVDAPPPAPPQMQAQNHWALLLDAKYNAEHDLGLLIDINSYKLLNQRGLEYDVTIKQMALSAAHGNKVGFEQMVNQLQGAIYQNQLFLVNMMRKVVEAKAEALAQEKKEQPTAANENCATESPSAPAV